jgi:hypothetical protein
MRILVAAAAVSTFALVAAGALGVASAEAPTTTTPPPTVSVQGVATEPIEQTANATTATTVYRQGMADAIVDGQAKALFLAGKAGVALGAVQSIVENGGYIGCSGEESEYLGEQPDFGSPGGGTTGISTPRAVPEAVPVLRKPAVKHTKKKSHHVPVAKHASTASCTLSAQVSLAYALG